ncbi:SMC family ATPase [Robertmurraya yapensis]|uniref:Nuclease SbcCD subunit C n=1 Tax=Bacillus yapensis TaxID=2492960 RepID=A0A431WJX9_9BACI|nr:AAA family ATPase [Bacillus yapensis]RTR35705.1 SMC family ATPase [Bacillus yapensis]TKS98507.1 SMC family ATPase [Bacillus yapensis]
MRPIKLTMQAFGPYAGTEVIDFASLGNRTMFVISGKTGAGKTTIFDGISYAIYGKASGEDRNGPELRSQFASDDLNTEVSLQFSLRGKSYFIKRSPQQDKKKERGDGYRTVGATAELYQFDEHGEQQLLAANVRDVEEKIKEIMLIDSNQFRQILMIPQGEFRKLLTSDSKEKEAILQRLFHTEIYKRVEEKLKEEATALKKSVEKQMEDRNLLIRKITALYNEELQDYLVNGSENDVLIFPLLEDEIEQMKEQLEAVSKEVNDKTKDKELLSQKLYDAEIILKNIKSRDELGARKIELEGQKDNIATKERVIDLANKAALLAKQDELCHRLSNEKKALLKDAEIREVRMAELRILLQQREEAWLKEKDREGERKVAQEAIHSLNQIKEEVKSFALLEQEVLKLENKLNQLKQQHSTEEERLKLLDEKLKLLQEEKSSLEKTDLLLLENDRKLDKLENELTLLTKYEEQQVRYKENTSLLETKKGIFGQTQARLEDAKLLVTELDNRWLHGQAANLASQLHDGEACPVCGSTTHPNPAAGSGTDLPNEEDLKAAKEQVVSLEQEKTAAESAFLEIQSRTNTMRDTIEDLLSDIVKVRNDFSENMVEPLKNQLLDDRKVLQLEQLKLSENKQKLAKITKELEATLEQKETIANTVVALNGTVNEASLTFTENRTKLEGLKVRIPEELRDYRKFEEKLQAAIQHQDLLQQRFEQTSRAFQETKERFASEESGLLTVRKHAEDKEKELDVERDAFVEQMKAQGFSDYKQFDAAKKSAGEIEQLGREIREYGQELRSVTDRYQELSEALKDVQIPDMEGLKLALHEVQEQITALNNTYTNLLIKKRDNEEIRDSILRINEEMKNLEERYNLVGELYDIARGQNASKITFERYVLAAFLDDILLEANGRLLKMTSGRYSMHRKKDRAKGNAQSGLELLVFDQYTGQERHVKTLSGGESFKAALSLALGLADVVQNYAGGVSLETMFIDEGFGTLDPESLDQAIEALIDIQSSGRLVGIISHVPELRERIDARLEVTATQIGSTTEFHLLNG